MKDDRLYLIHILESIERVEEYTCQGLEQFLSDKKTQDAVLRNLQILAESTQRISPELKTANPEIDWRGISGFRNVLVHDYLGVNLITVWGIIEGPLKELKNRMSRILEDLQQP
ncbi:MAG: hypothetical protein A4E49_02445 [Methanosaeta sp. PtaU1.Bin112]|nr:MAG: hypothetical protein A4E49_02445 [Methanosaeta sp. PtaU1.Bin112]